MKSILFPILATITLVPFLVSQGNTHQPFSMTISAEQRIVKMGQPARVKIVLTNLADTVISIHHTGPACDYSFIVLDGKGQPTRSLNPCGLGSGGLYLTGRDFTTQLKPGESESDFAEISWLFDINKPGKYSVQVARKYPPGLGDGVVKSNVIVITMAE